MKLIFEFHFKKKEGFSESDFMGIVSKRLSALGKEMPISFLDIKGLMRDTYLKFNINLFCQE